QLWMTTILIDRESMVGANRCQTAPVLRHHVAAGRHPLFPTELDPDARICRSAGNGGNAGCGFVRQRVVDLDAGGRLTRIRRRGIRYDSRRDYPDRRRRHPQLLRFKKSVDFATDWVWWRTVADCARQIWRRTVANRACKLAGTTRHIRSHQRAAD